MLLVIERLHNLNAFFLNLMTLHPTTREKQKDMVQKTNLIAEMSSARTNYLQMVFKIAKAIQMKKKLRLCQIFEIWSFSK